MKEIYCFISIVELPLENDDVVK